MRADHENITIILHVASLSFFVGYPVVLEREGARNRRALQDLLICTYLSFRNDQRTRASSGGTVIRVELNGELGDDKGNLSTKSTSPPRCLRHFEI